MKPRCTGCGKLLAEKVTRPWVIMCGRCKTWNREDDVRDRHVVVETDSE